VRTEGEKKVVEIVEGLDKVPKIFTPVEGAHSVLKGRGLSSDTCKFWDYKVGKAINPATKQMEDCHIANFKDESNRIIGQKLRFAPRTVKKADGTEKKVNDFSTQGDCTSLYGKHLWTTGLKIVITEGELDALSLSQIQRHKYPVVSLPNGTGSALKTIKKDLRWLEENFKEIILMFDNDTPGSIALEDVAPLFAPGTCKIAKLPLKDANDMLVAGKVAELTSAVFNAKTYRPDGIVTVGDIIDRIGKKPEQGLSTGFDTMDQLVYGCKTGKFDMWTSGSGMGKCLGIDTEIILFNGETKKVQDITPQDVLMGVGGERRKVLSITTGKDELYEVIPTKGTPYVVNSEHILSLRKVGSGRLHNIKVTDYLKLSEKDRTSLKTWRPDCIETGFNEELLYSPYIIGLWLGDGHKKGPILTNVDNTILNEWCSFGESIGLVPTYYNDKRAPHVKTVALSRKTGDTRGNSFFDYLKGDFINGEFKKHIKPRKLTKEHRLQLLAGILDTDGSVEDNVSFEVSQVSKQLSQDIAYLARSLGLMTTETTRVVKGNSYYRCRIFGNVTIIPTRLKKVRKRIINKNPLHHGIKEVRSLGMGDYYGFELSGDKLFLLKDFQVTHNTEVFKSIAAHLMRTHNQKVATIFLEEEAADTAVKVAGKLVKKRFDSPEYEFDIAERNAVLTTMQKDKLLYMNDEFGGGDYNSLKSMLRYLVITEECKYIFLDHVTAFTDGLDGSSANQLMEKMMKELATMTRELDFHLSAISHIRKANNADKSAEDGGRITMDDMKGSGAIKQWANNIFALERNMSTEEEEERNVSTIRLLKVRDAGHNIGRYFKIKYTPETGELIEHKEF
jgi:replicative DNA helicase